MSKKSFSAKNWFVKEEIDLEKDSARLVRDRSAMPADEVSSNLPAFHNSPEESLNIETELNRFFVPGWKGESLISKDVKGFIKILEIFHQDAKKSFNNIDQLSRKLKLAIFDEFLSFADYKVLNCNSLDHYTTFWSELKNENSEYREELDHFIDILTFRIAVIYLLKVRFIVTLLDKTDSKFDIKNVYYPNSFLTSVFKSASSTELKTKAFEQNVFSWYRPSEGLKDHLINFKEICGKINITQLIKTLSIKSEEILNQKTFYSHSLSHKNFGLFLNSLLINFPVWLSTLGNRNSSYFQKRADEMEIISCKFSGDYLESMALSHWLAQDTNKNIKWDQILCPDFKKHDFETGMYMKILNELQFLTFLAEIANIQGKEPKSFVSNIINSHLYNRKNSSEIQKSLLLGDSSINHSTYDRVILNLHEFPKNNPQHFLFNQIQGQKQFLKDGGLLYVITSKKLFVPSQKSKIDALLDDFKVEGIINLEEVKGKGEVGSYVYIFTSKNRNLPTYTSSKETKKRTCLNFRLSAQLKSFHYFGTLTKLTHQFFDSNLGDVPPMYQKVEDNFRFEFFQDAIVNGQLIHSSSKDSSKITHPSFFKKLMNLCNPFDYFFSIQNVDFNRNQYGHAENETFFDFSSGFQKEESPYTIIVDQRDKENIRIEIISTNLLEAKAYEYGHTLCSYFYAFPKWPNLNIFALKDYFDSTIGKQIINLTFNNEIRKVKGNLNKLLIPRFFASYQELPNHLAQGLNLFKTPAQDLLTMHPTELEKKFNDLECLLPTLSKNYPTETLNQLANFKRSIHKSLEIIGNSNRTNSINFNNPLLKTPLLLSKTYPIYPDNKEVYIEFNPNAMKLIHAPLDRVKKSIETKDDYTSHKLEFFSQDTMVLSIYTDEDMICFLEFLTGEIQGAPISKILQGVQVPKLDDLKAIISSSHALQRTISSIYSKLPQNYDRIINSIIFQ